jgi:predicted nucleic acid-binding Zn finger protein
VSEGPADGDGDGDGDADADTDDAEERSDGDGVGAAENDSTGTDTDGDGESDGGSGAGEGWRGTLAEAGALTPDAVSAIAETHGDRGLQAIEAVSEGRVKQYRDFTVVVGHTDEYVVEGGGCTCKDSAYNLDRENPDARCWHALAVDVAEALGEVDHHDMWYSEVREFL